MENLEQLVNEYQKNIENAKKYFSYTNEVREYNGYIFKKMRHNDRLENEMKWLKRLMHSDYNIPKLVGVYNNIIITEKIDGKTIEDTNAHSHFYNIGKLIADLHNIPVQENLDWKENIKSQYIEIKNSVENSMENNIFESVTNFLETGIENLSNSKNVIIHSDIRPENIIYSNGDYFLIDLENMNIGDKEYDFTRILNLLNEKEFYNYEDFKNLIDGYRSVNEIKLSEEKWQLYNKFYPFRIYSRMLCGKVGKDDKYEKYLKSILLSKDDKVTNWIKKYNEGRLI